MGLAQYSKCTTKYERVAFIFAHLSIFTIYVWFGFLKVIGVSPADTVVEGLLSMTMPWWPFESFFLFLGVFEMFVGILFLIPKMERIAIPLLVIHMITTFGPLVLTPETVWAGFLVPTLAGQYIIKNLIIIALAASILVDLKDKKRKR